MTSYKASFKTVMVQGLECYQPRIHWFENGKKLYSEVISGWPLVTKKDAIKYAHLHAQDRLVGVDWLSIPEKKKQFVI